MAQKLIEQASLPVGQMRRAKANPPNDTKSSFENRTIVVTGANTGIGLEAALKFVRLHATKVVLAVRTISKGQEAQHYIEAQSGRRGVVEVWQLDMLDYDSIAAFASRAQKLPSLDIVVLNAGVISASYQQSQYGWERDLQVNVLSTTFLSLMLLPKLRASRTVNFTPVLELVGSGNHQGILSMQTISGESPLITFNDPKHFDMSTQYNVSKLFLEYAKSSLSKLVVPASSKQPEVIVTSVCPGATKSDLGRDIKGPMMRAAASIFSYLFQRTTEEGARSYVSGTLVGTAGHGGFWTNDKLVEPSPLIRAAESNGVRASVWKDIVQSLERDVPRLSELGLY